MAWLRDVSMKCRNLSRLGGELVLIDRDEFTPELLAYKERLATLRVGSLVSVAIPRRWLSHHLKVV
jgi:hypothetical protein